MKFSMPNYTKLKNKIRIFLLGLGYFLFISNVLIII
jgi:hypothetical protein